MPEKPPSKRHKTPLPWQTADDRDRVAEERRRIQQAAISAYPVEIDEETTPPPSEPSAPSAIPGYGTLPPEVREQLEAIHITLREHDVGFTRVWDARHVRDELSQLRVLVSGMAVTMKILENVPAALNQAAVRFSVIENYITNQNVLNDRLYQTLDGLDKRLDTVEDNYIALNATITSLGQQLATKFQSVETTVATLDRETTASLKEHDQRIRLLEDNRAAIAEVKGHGDRLRSLEDSRLVTNTKIGVVAGIAAVVVSLGIAAVEHYVFK